MESQSEYMRRRACEEESAAERASSPKVRELHIELADRYRDAAMGRPLPMSPDEAPRFGLPDDFKILE